MTLALAGTGWTPDVAVIVHYCPGHLFESLDMGVCRPVGSVTPDAVGRLSDDVVLPVDVGAPDAPTAGGWVVASQGDHVVLMTMFLAGPSIDIGNRPSTFPTTVSLDVLDLRAGEVAEVQTCRTATLCSSPIGTFEVIGNGTGSDPVDVEITEQVRGITLIVDGIVIHGSSWADHQLPVDIPHDAPPAAITVEPASVPGPGTYEFTVRGIDWLSAPPVFILPCDAGVAAGLDVELGDACDTANLTPVTPVDGAFEVTVTYDVGPDGLVIAAGDAAQTQSATATVTVE